jgi:hypothetical protein
MPGTSITGIITSQSTGVYMGTESITVGVLSLIATHACTPPIKLSNALTAAVVRVRILVVIRARRLAVSNRRFVQANITDISAELTVYAGIIVTHLPGIVGCSKIYNTLIFLRNGGPRRTRAFDLPIMSRMACDQTGQ